jgi:5'-nucleotidase
MIEWVDQAHVLLVQYGLARSTISKAVCEAVQTQRFGLREHLDEFLSLLSDAKVPTLIFSAGIADVLEEVLRTQVATASWDHLHVISNRCIYHEDNEQVQGFVQPLLHVFNKRSSAYLHTDYFKVPDLPKRQCLLLLGDSLGDITMAEGMGIPDENILKVGFLNDRPERLQQYLECFDLVILDDPGFDIPIKIVEEITRGVSVL